MTMDVTNSLKNLCRACMTSVADIKKFSRGTNHNQSIFEKPSGCEEGPTIMELLQLVQPLIIVQTEDDLPKIMCFACIQQLQLAHVFLEMCKDSDEKFRKLLKEIHLVEEVSTKDFDETPEFKAENVNVDDIEEENDFAKVTKYEIEIEECGKATPIPRDALDIDRDDEEFPEFEDEPEPNNITDEDEGKQEIFDNPYSDASDNEWTPKEDARKNSLTKSLLPRRRKTLIESCPKRKNNSKTLKQKSKDDKSNRKPLPTINDDGSVQCQECEDILENIKIWRSHMRSHRLEKLSNKKCDDKVRRSRKNHECEHCGKVFQKTTAYKNHVRIHTGEEPYLCIECGKRFKIVSSLNTHMLRHKGEKKIQCPQCPKKFVCSSGLYAHMMVHNKDKPYVCDMCGSAFHKAYLLKKHNLHHKGIKNFPCEYCDLRFVTAEKQRRHMRTHTGEKPYRCKYCDRAFAQSNDCNKHLKQHLGENIYQCELCPLRFPLVRDLRVHFATHKDDNEETRARNLEAREAEEKSLKIKLGVKDA